MRVKNVDTVERARYTLVNRRKLVVATIKKQKGITLVALVITIIILLILAGVTIASIRR